jgi:hypothetical protein
MASTTEDGNKKAAEDFESGFNEEITKPEQTEDEAFGLTPDEAPGTESTEGSAPAVAIVVTGDKDAPHGEMPTGGDETAAATNEEAPAATEAEPALDIEKEKQRLKSWEGRLRAKEAELAARQAEEATETPAAEAAEQAAGEVPDEDDADIKALSEDFGPEFVTLLTSLIAKIARKTAAETASEHTAPFRKDIDDVIAEMTNEKQRLHFEKISDAFPDFMEIAESDAFKAWGDAMAPEDKAEFDRIVASGSAREIIGLLKRYKAASTTDSGIDEDALDNAEGVRSTGLKLPESPSSKDDFASAWNEH